MAGVACFNGTCHCSKWNLLLFLQWTTVELWSIFDIITQPFAKVTQFGQKTVRGFYTVTYYSLTDLTSKTNENQISSKPMTILRNWGLNHWLFTSSSQIKILPTNWSSKISLLWRFSLLTSKLTLCSGITKLFAFCPLCVWDLDESLPGLRYPLSRSSSVCKKNSPFF